MTAKTKRRAAKQHAHTVVEVVPCTLPATKGLPEGVVTKMWRAGKSLTEIARKIGPGTRPNGTGFRVGRIRRVLTNANLYPRKSTKK